LSGRWAIAGSGWGACAGCSGLVWGAARATFEVGGVPARAFELKARGGELLGKRGFAAFGAVGQWRICNFLQDVLGMAAGTTFVGVNWHDEEGSVKP